MIKNAPKVFTVFMFLFAFAAVLTAQPGRVCAQRSADESKQDEAIFVAQKAYDDGFYDVALSLLNRFIQSYPSSPKIYEAYYLMGQCYFHLNRFYDALKQFEDLLNHPGARSMRDAIVYWTAEVHFRGNNFGKAAEYYRIVINDYPRSDYIVSAYYSLGWALFQEGKYGEALEYFNIVVSRYPKQPQADEASFKILECYYNLKQYERLKELAREYLKQFSSDKAKIPYLYYYWAEAQFYTNNYSEAAQIYEKTINASRDTRMQAIARLGLAWSYLKLKQYPKARDVFGEIAVAALEKKSQDVFYLGKAIMAFETGSYSDARQAYEDLMLLSEDPDVLFQSYLGKAESLYNLGQYSKALEVYKLASRALTADPSGKTRFFISDPVGDKPAAAGADGGISSEMVDKLHSGMAWAYLKTGEFKEAIQEFRKIVKHTEDKIFKVSAICQIGDAYQDSGDYQKALETYDSILHDYPDSFYTDYVQYQIGLTQMRLSNYDGAIVSFSSLKNNFPSSKLLDDAVYSLGLAYFQKQDYASSRLIFEKFIDDHKDSPLRSQAMYLWGTSLFNTGKFAEAVDVFKNVVRYFAQDQSLVQKAEYEIADCYYQMGDEKEALNRFNSLRDKYPDSGLSAEIIWWLGGYYYRHKEMDRALQYFTSLIQKYPQSEIVPDAYYAIGSIHLAGAKLDDAVTYFNKVVELGPSDLAAQAAIAIADIRTRTGDPDDAVAAYRQKLKEYPHLGHLIYPKIADILYKQGKNEEALRLYMKSLELVPQRQMPEIQFRIAEILQSQGKIPEAVEAYLRVPYLFSGNKAVEVAALLRVARIYEDQDNIREAVAMYEKIVRMNTQEAAFARERIESLKGADK